MAISGNGVLIVGHVIHVKGVLVLELIRCTLHTIVEIMRMPL